MLDIFEYRGNALMQSLMCMSIAIFGFNWLAHNLFRGVGPAQELSGVENNKQIGAYSLTVLMGVTLGLFWLVNDLKQVADFTDSTLAFLEFPLIIIGGYGLITFARQSANRTELRLTAEKRYNTNF